MSFAFSQQLQPENVKKVVKIGISLHYVLLSEFWHCCHKTEREFSFMDFESR